MKLNNFTTLNNWTELKTWAELANRIELGPFSGLISWILSLLTNDDTTVTNATGRNFHNLDVAADGLTLIDYPSSFKGGIQDFLLSDIPDLFVLLFCSG